jgi:ATP-binding cassette subfamily G (WHITE) protein 2
MCQGRNVYHGPASTMLPYFNAQGYECELHDNPADFVMDVLIDVSRKNEDWEKLKQAYLESRMYASINAASRTQVHDDSLASFHQKQGGAAAARSFGTEIYYVSQRTLKNAIRNPILFLSQIIVSIILGLLVGLVFNSIQRTTDPGVQNRLGAIFFIIVSQIFCTVTALEPLVKERALFIHVSFVPIDKIE